MLLQKIVNVLVNFLRFKLKNIQGPYEAIKIRSIIWVLKTNVLTVGADNLHHFRDNITNKRSMEIKMKLLGILALLSFSSIAMATDSFSCKTTTFQTQDKIIKIRIAKNVVHFEGIGSMPVLEKVSMQIDGQVVKDCLSIETSHECLKGLVPNAKEKDDSKLSLLNNLLFLTPSKPGDEDFSDINSQLGVPTIQDLDVAKIRSGILHVLQFGGNYPNVGVYEYFDKKGVLLGRMYHEVIPRMCR